MPKVYVGEEIREFLESIVNGDGMPQEVCYEQVLKMPNEIMTDLELVKFQAADSASTQKVEGIVTDFYNDLERTAKKVKKLKKQKKKFRRRFALASNAAYKLKEENKYLESTVADQDADIIQKKEIVSGLETDVLDLLETLEAQSDVLDNIGSLVGAVRDVRSKTKLAQFLGDIKALLKKRPQTEKPSSK